MHQGLLCGTFLPVADAAIVASAQSSNSRDSRSTAARLPKPAIQIGQVAPFPNWPFAALMSGVSHAGQTGLMPMQQNLPSTSVKSTDETRQCSVLSPKRSFNINRFADVQTGHSLRRCHTSGLCRLFAILCPPFPKHIGGPIQIGRLIV